MDWPLQLPENRVFHLGSLSMIITISMVHATVLDSIDSLCDLFFSTLLNIPFELVTPEKAGIH